MKLYKQKHESTQSSKSMKVQPGKCHLTAVILTGNHENSHNWITQNLTSSSLNQGLSSKNFI